MTVEGTHTIERLRQVGLRPTRQRLALAEMMFDGCHRHLTAELLHAEALHAKIKVSLATIYNTLHQFTDAGLLREVSLTQGRSYFDTNVDAHHHFYFEGTGQLVDIPSGSITLASLPQPPEGMAISRIDVVIRISTE